MATTAAVLNILVKANTAQAQAALGKTQGALRATDKAGGRTASRLKTGMKVAGVGMAAGLGLAIVAGKKFVDAAAEAETSNARMRAQLKASGIAYGKHADHIEKVIQKTSKLSALDDEDLQDSFTNIVRVTGDVNKSLKLTGLAADFARGKQIDVAKAGEIVAKVAGGNTGILSRYGIKVKEGASATEALGMLQKKFAGQAEAYGKTTAGAQDRFKVATENLFEVLGAKLLPVLAKVMNFAADFVNDLIEGTGAAGGFAHSVSTAFSSAQGFVGKAVAAIRGFLSDHRADIASARQAVVNIGKAVKWAWETIALPVVKRVLPAIRQIIEGVLKVIGGIIRVFTGLLTGDFRKAWNGVKQIFSGALQVIAGYVRAATAPIREAAARVGSAISGAFRAAWDRVKDLFNGVKGWMGDKLHAIGKAVSGFAGDVKDGIVAAFKGAVNTVIGFVNNIINVLNRIPGVNIDHIGKLKSTASTSSSAAGKAIANAPKVSRSGMGGPGIGGPSISDLSPKKLIDMLPSADKLGWLAGLGKEVLAQVGKWIKDKLASVLGPYLASWGPIDKMASSYGLSITSTYRPGDDGYHGISIGGGRARATDYSNGVGTKGEFEFAKAVQARFGKGIKELIHTPLGYGINNGSIVPLSFWGAATNADHYDHVHVAFRHGGVAPGGLAMVGEAGRELVHLPSGSRVYNHGDTERMMAGAGGAGSLVHIEHMTVHDRFDERRFAADLAWRLQTS